MRPTYQPKPLINQTPSEENGSLATLKGIRCPQGTVPIRRTQKEDLIRAKDFSVAHTTNITQQSADFPDQHVAILKPLAKSTTYHGVYSHINVYSLKVNPDQYSTAQMWVENGHSNQRTSLQAGWMVAPQIAGNSDTRLFIYWKMENSKTGCFNHLCPGFVQVNPEIGPGSQFNVSSIYGGKQFLVRLAIFQDKVTGNWWLQLNDAISVGYWPKSLLPELDGGAHYVAWGGTALGPPNGDSPPMGNGQFPSGNFRKACFIQKLYIVDESYSYIRPEELSLESYVDNKKCYGLDYYGYLKNRELTFLFGGPGGKCEL